MDRTDWPWSWEEEVEWKADLQDRDYDLLQKLIDDAVGDSTSDSRYSAEPVSEVSSEDDASQENFVTA